MKKFVAFCLIFVLIATSCSSTGRNCKGAREKWGYYNSLQFGKAPAKTLKKKR